MGTIIAISATTIYGLYVLCSDLMYVTLFPQLTLVLWMPSCNAYGCVAGFFLSFILRLLCGEPVLGVPAALRFPYYDVENNVQLFPFRTFCMLLGTLTIVVVSMATNYVFLSKKVPAKYDFLKCYKQRTIRMHISDEQVDHTYVVPGDKTETANI